MRWARAWGDQRNFSSAAAAEHLACRPHRAACRKRKSTARFPLLGLLSSLGCWVRARQKPSKDPAKTQHLGKWQGGLARRAHSRLGGLGARRFSRHTPGNRPAGAACSFSRLAHKPPTPHRPFAAILCGHLPTCFPALLGQKKSFC